MGETLFVKQGLEASFNRYQQEVLEQAQQVFEAWVKPFCKKNNLKFIAGMGTYWIGTKEGVWDRNDMRDNEEFQAVSDYLDLDVPGLPANSLGSLMPDVSIDTGR